MPGSRRLDLAVAAALALAAGPAFAPPAPAAERSFPLGDTLTVIRRPLLNIPAIVQPGDTLRIHCAADPGTTGWQAELRFGAILVPLDVIDAAYDASTLWWTLAVRLPGACLHELYDLRVAASGGVEDVTANAVRVIPGFREDFYFVHVTDPHLPDPHFSSDGAQPEDSAAMDDLREVIEDINLMNPEFVLLTGDLVNEGELEDYMEWRAYSRSQRLLTELEVPVYLTSGNHDLGGWDATPPPDGTARRDWWRFFGWPRLDAPPPGAPWYTQNYSFDYGPVHFTGLEAYDNYDGWRYGIYGGESFTAGQMDWLAGDLAGSAAAAKVLFHHYDFKDQLDLDILGVDLALWGHIHHDEGSIYDHPFDLSTNNVCWGERAYRVIRVSGTTLIPQATVSAGADGNAMRLQFSPPNDGTNATVMALVANEHDLRFEHGLVKFNMPKGGTDPQLSEGTILQVDTSPAGWDVYYVEVDIAPESWGTITLTVTEPTAVPGGEAPALVMKLPPNHPNPFNPATTMPFFLPRAQHARLRIFDAAGRPLAVLVDGALEAGWHRAEWRGRDDRGREMPAGVYLVRLEAGGEARTRRIAMIR
ncbi:MAG: metallophosphoesterase [Candidatus Krumholzibacteriota bacterium]|nr:metallophosphoesterase [Candidatus Krumholzibacteriota bacterium]